MAGTKGREPGRETPAVRSVKACPPVPSSGPVLAVKTGNLAPGRPQTGLTGAEIVYVIPVEGYCARRRVTWARRLRAGGRG